MAPVFKNVGGTSTTLLVFFLRLIKILEKLVTNRIVDHIGKCGLFSDFQYTFSLSTAQGTTRAVVLDISKAFDRV